jgi:hypothetical protein
MKWPTLAALFCSTAALAEAPPAGLDRQAVVQGMTAIRPQLQACYAEHKVGGVATVELTIAPAGTVTRAAVAPPVDGWGDFQPDSPTATCIVRAVLGARFPAFHGAAMTLAYPIVLRADGPQPTPPDATLEQAQKAYVAGRYAEAITLAREGRAAQPSRAWRIIGASSCFLKDAAGAGAAWRELDEQSRKFVEYVCANNRVTIDKR